VFVAAFHLCWHLDADNRAQPRLIVLLPGRVPSDLERAHQNAVRSVSDSGIICEGRRIERESVESHTCRASVLNSMERHYREHGFDAWGVGYYNCVLEFFWSRLN
jgi:hypothetical protein